MTHLLAKQSRLLMVSYRSCLNAVAQRNTSREKTQQLSDEKWLEEWDTLAAVNCGKQDMILSVFLNESDVISTAQLFFTFEKSAEFQVTKQLVSIKSLE